MLEVEHACSIPSIVTLFMIILYLSLHSMVQQGAILNIIAIHIYSNVSEHLYFDSTDILWTETFVHL